MTTLRQTAQEIDWLSRGYLAKFLGYAIIISGIVFAVYRFLDNFLVIELVTLVLSTLVLGGLFLLISWFFQGD